MYVCNGLCTNIFYMACVQIFLILSQVNNFFFIARLIGRAFFEWNDTVYANNFSFLIKPYDDDDNDDDDDDEFVTREFIKSGTIDSNVFGA